MSFNWLEWSNPVAVWWSFLVSVSIVNIFFWILTWRFLSRKKLDFYGKSIVWFSLVYVIVCAFRSFLPRADVLRICLFDTWLSNVFVGRSFATIGELSFICQWAIALYLVSKVVGSKSVERISKVIVPLILLAECFSWYAVITTNYLGNAIEESTWALTYILITVCLVALFLKFKGKPKVATIALILGTSLYVFFMMRVDVPMYLGRWQSDLAEGKRLLGFFEGIHDLQTRWVVTHEINDWRDEIPWMSLYFSLAVWTSLGLCYASYGLNQNNETKD